MVLFAGHGYRQRCTALEASFLEGAQILSLSAEPVFLLSPFSPVLHSVGQTAATRGGPGWSEKSVILFT